MKKLILKLILLFTFSIGYSQVSDIPEITKNDLIELIQKAKNEGKINDNSLLVLDEEIILNVNEITDNQKFFGEIRIINKGNKGMVQIYGEKAINGIIMIQSPPKTPKESDIEISRGIVLFFINEKEVSENELKKLSPDSIQNVQVIKSKDEIKKHTDKECDGIIIIKLKKTN
ncbi:hypothetical protein [uncultured Tenacibaculum sp.]|uniref:hypothetical protein n=1 Tax=uncultured Tenacibaculum sp. TaxID=174713 RepID=UPI00260379A3|nr:hypothetical protein [uncultured Tenacibaculum sp.]